MYFQTGTLRYCGPTEFAGGLWAGIELDDEAGKNDGSVAGISYFQCSPKHGEILHTVKFLNFWTPKNFAVIYLKLK